MTGRKPDETVSKSMELFFRKLEDLYPEHKVFALDSLDKHLRERLSRLSKDTGYETGEEFLKAHGFSLISGDDVRKIRNTVLYTPGNEPEVIRGKVDSAIRRLKEYYPDSKITRGIQQDHRELAKDISGLYQWLGYENQAAMLAAYGFTVAFESKGGRPATNDYQQIIKALQEKYRDVKKPDSLIQLIEENPELKGQVKTISNKSTELFGMTAAQFFRENGILQPKVEMEEKTVAVRKSEVWHYFMARTEGKEQSIPCLTTVRSIHEGDAVEMSPPGSEEKLIGEVITTHYYSEKENLPCPVDKMYRCIRKVPKSELKEIEASKIKYIYCRVRLEDSSILYYISPFENIGVGDIVKVPNAWRGEVDAVVAGIERVSEKTAPYPVKKTKRIISIIKSHRLRKEIMDRRLDLLKKRNGVETFSRQNISQEIIDKPGHMAFLDAAVMRGLEADAEGALRRIYPGDLSPLDHAKELDKGVLQFECDSDVLDIIREFPNLKAAFFAEDWQNKMVYLAYSESGYPTITSLREIGKCDLYVRDRWPLIHDPTEAAFSFDKGGYTFEEKTLWERCDYVLPDGRTRLGNKTVIPSKPEHRPTSADPVGIIKISYPEPKPAPASRLRVGSRMVFGRYPQGENGEEMPIEWEILEMREDHALLVSRYALDAKAFDETGDGTDWAECSLRKWLNGEFYKKAFDGTEQKSILSVELNDSGVERWGSGDTSDRDEGSDRVFLLSHEEAFKMDSIDECLATEYAVGQGAWTDYKQHMEYGDAEEWFEDYTPEDIEYFKKLAYWWLRSAFDEDLTEYVEGEIGCGIEAADCWEIRCVRPAIWLKL